MSKSLGNFFTVRDLLEQGIPGEVIRFVLLSTHYRSPMDWTEKKVREAEKTLDKWYFTLLKANFTPELIDVYKEQGVWSPSDRVVAMLASDLNTSGALSILHELSSAPNSRSLIPFAASLELLGLIDDWSILADLARIGVSHVGEYDPRVVTLISELILKRQNARALKDFNTSDSIRDSLISAGVEIQDTGGIPSWSLNSNFDPSKLEALK